jgi:AbrB family looped-hinge helix DNA binding protein
LYRRKVQVVGGSTYIVSIPKQWAEEIGITEGSEVAVEKLYDNSLKIYPVSGKAIEPPSSRLHFSCEESDEVIARTIIAQYLSVAKEIKITASDVGCKERILKIVGFLKSKVLGLEVVEETANEIILGIIVDFRFSNLLSAQQKMLKTLSSMFEDIVNSVLNGNMNMLSDVFKRDDLLDRLYLYSIRYITALASTTETQERIPPQLLPHYALIAKSLERIGDHISAIAKNLKESIEKREIGEEQLVELEKFLREAQNLLVMMSRLSEKFDYPLLVEATGTAISMLNKEIELRRGLSHPTLFYSYIVESCRRIVAYSIDVLESLLDIAALVQRSLG